MACSIVMSKMSMGDNSSMSGRDERVKLVERSKKMLQNQGTG